MTAPTLLVNLDTGRPNTGLLHVASSLADRLGAHVIGVAARQSMRMQMDLSGTCYIAPKVFNDERAETEIETGAAEAEFRGAFPGHDLSWRSSVSFGQPSDYIACQARHADLVLTGTPDGKGDATRATAGELVMQCGRPVLVIPAAIAVAAPSLDRVMLAWKDTREARRAALDALPLFKMASYVAIVEIAADEELAAARERVDDVSRWLAGHGVVAEPTAAESRQDDAGQLESLAHSSGVTMIVAGVTP